MRGIQSYMGWPRIPDLDTSAATYEDNPIASPRKQPPGKLSFQM